ncbi:amino acid ABC transporter permease, partial [Rhodovulum sulfidophilum]|nr:amino acid ABC transporter permease [Rhodovulum sulfidophilum]
MSSVPSSPLASPAAAAYDPDARLSAPAWLRANLFSSVWQSLLTLVVAVVLFRFFWFVLDWGVVNAVFYTTDPDVCRAA